MTRTLACIAALLLSGFFSIIYGQAQQKIVVPSKDVGSGPTQFFPLTELREGMRGVARTVFRGSEPEEFSVEILGVLPGGVGPKQDLIIGRLSGGQAERTAVFAGMSGSPVYINGKLVGAISYSFPFAKEPICGITPIEQMVSIFEKKQRPKPVATEPRAVSFSELAATVLPDLYNSSGISNTAVSGPSANSGIAAIAGQSFQPIATPVTFTGFSQQTLDLFAPQLIRAGLMPVSAAGGSSPITEMKKYDEFTLRGGDSVSMQLTRGDYSLAASGTVTFRDGEKIYAFGHPFLGLGTSDLPMSESRVVTVIPNVSNSFKIAVPEAMVGSMVQDRATGVYGNLGKAPKMIPVKIDLETSRGGNETISFEVANDDFLTPLLLNISIYNAIVANERQLGDSMIEVSGEIKVAAQESVKLQRRLAGLQASQFAAASVAVPVNTLLRSHFDNLQIDEISLKLKSFDGSRTAVLERIAVDKAEVRAGETFEVQAFARNDAGQVFVQRTPVTLPPDTPEGSISVVVGEGDILQQKNSVQQFVPKNAAELIGTMNKAKRPDRLYVQTVRSTNGAVIGINEMPNLPPSMLATLNNERAAGGLKPVLQTIITEMQMPPADFIITGQQTIVINVIK